jgi:hypothetical protein
VKAWLLIPHRLTHLSYPFNPINDIREVPNSGLIPQLSDDFLHDIQALPYLQPTDIVLGAFSSSDL